jgi:hypothetical protein
MGITGPKIPASTVIAGISGTTITLAQAVSFADILGAVTTKTLGLYQPIFSGYTTTWTDSFEPSGVAIGQYIAGPGINIEQGVTVTAVLIGSGTYRRIVLSHYISTNRFYRNGQLVSEDHFIGTYTFYTPQAQSLQTYTFSAPDRTYTFRTDTTLPFGGFPGVGGFTL